MIYLKGIKLDIFKQKYRKCYKELHRLITAIDWKLYGGEWAINDIRLIEHLEYQEHPQEIIVKGDRTIVIPWTITYFNMVVVCHNRKKLHISFLNQVTSCPCPCILPDLQYTHSKFIS